MKGLNGSALYGSRGSNGVIIVTTKRGKSGKPLVNLNTFVGLNMAPKKYDVMIGTFGHAGDGNLHPTILTDLRDSAEEAKVEKVIEEIFIETIKLDGTLSGEHGIGITKAKYLKLEISEDAYKLMKRIKKAFDPNNILNPGKLFLT
jgi:glycolate oxidase